MNKAGMSSRHLLVCCYIY